MNFEPGTVDYERARRQEAEARVAGLETERDEAIATANGAMRDRAVVLNNTEGLETERDRYRDALEEIAERPDASGNHLCAQIALSPTEVPSVTKYFLDFTDRGQMMRKFTDYDDRDNPIEGFPTDDEILFASYAPGCYCGDAVVVFQREGKFYMNEASHCSCFGLENQWGPDEIDPAQLLGYKLGDDHGAKV